MKTKQIAFWRHDTFPFCLWGEILNENTGSYPGPGHYEIQGYGKGFWFQPFMILPESEAKPIMERLSYLKMERRTRMFQVEEDFTILLKAVLPDHPKFSK